MYRLLPLMNVLLTGKIKRSFSDELQLNFFSEDIGSGTEHEHHISFRTCRRYHYTVKCEPYMWKPMPTSLHCSFSFQHNIMKFYPLCLEYHPLTPWLPTTQSIIWGCSTSQGPYSPTSPVTYQLHIFLSFFQRKTDVDSRFFRNNQLNIF
jgi:hypothetical protein